MVAFWKYEKLMLKKYMCLEVANVLKKKLKAFNVLMHDFLYNNTSVLY